MRSPCQRFSLQTCPLVPNESWGKSKPLYLSREKLPFHPRCLLSPSHMQGNGFQRLVKGGVLKALWDSEGLVSSLLKALHGAGHPQLKRESAADVGTETHPGSQPRAPAVPEGSSTAVHAQSRGRPGLAHPQDGKRGHRCQWAAPVPPLISQARS